MVVAQRVLMLDGREGGATVKITSMDDSARVLWEGECDNIREELVTAARSGANLGGADLRDADLGGAYLGGADLRDADLGGAYLGSANLRDANLGGADLRSANLRGANLRGANLRGANFPPMQSHDFWAELLLRAAGDNIERRKIAGLVLISRDWCWPRCLELIRGELAADWQEWAGEVVWHWPEACREVGLPEIEK